MMNCNRIQRLIDEADHNTLLSFEASNHLDGCHACRAFANERMRLRELLGTLPTITVPANFNGQLKARLEEAKAQTSFVWFSPAVYRRFGTATAILLVAVFGVQYSGVFTDTQSTPNTNLAINKESSKDPQVALPASVKPPNPVPPAEVIAGTRPRQSDGAGQPVSTNNRRSNRIPTRRTTEEMADNFDMPDGSVRPFSVGAQDRIYMRAESATPVRTVSF
jgi:hypothetical protein